MPKPSNVSAAAKPAKPSLELARRRLLRRLGGLLFPQLHRRWAAGFSLLPPRYLQNNGGVSDAVLINAAAKNGQPANQRALQEILCKPHILVFWHEALIAGFYLFSPRCKQPHIASVAGHSAATLISPSDDGEVLARSLRGLGLQVELGSSRLGGKAALAAVTKLLQSGVCQRLIITPDGPLGPALQSKRGALLAARDAAVPIVAVGLGFRSARRLKSWDRMWLPAFRDKVQLVFAEPLRVDSECAGEDLDELAMALSEQLTAVTLAAQHRALDASD